MTIHDLFKHIAKKYPKASKQIDISSFSGKVGLIDISTYLYKALYISGKRDLATRGFHEYVISIILLFKKHNIKVTFIFDGKFPKQKIETIAKRKDTRDKTEEKIFALEYDIIRYEEDGFIGDSLAEFKGEKDEGDSLLHISSTKEEINVQKAKIECDRLKNSILKITSSDITKIKELLDHFGIPYIQAEYESEAVAAAICRHSKIDFVISEDSDILAHRIPICLSKLQVKEEKCIMTKYKKVLQYMDLSDSQFLDFCIMCGTDYNERIPRVGPVTAEKLIRKHGSIEALKKSHDISVLKHKETRRMFLDPNYQGKLLDDKPLFTYEYGEETSIIFEEPIEFNFDFTWTVDFSKLLSHLRSIKYFNNSTLIKNLFSSEESKFDKSDVIIDETDSQTIDLL